jgi:hypothetical protein
MRESISFFHIYEDAALEWINNQLLENEETKHIQVEFYSDYLPRPSITSDHYMSRSVTLKFDENKTTASGAIQTIDMLFGKWKDIQGTTR